MKISNNIQNAYLNIRIQFTTYFNTTYVRVSIDPINPKVRLNTEEVKDRGRNKYHFIFILVKSYVAIFLMMWHLYIQVVAP